MVVAYLMYGLRELFSMLNVLGGVNGWEETLLGLKDTQWSNKGI